MYFEFPAFPLSSTSRTVKFRIDRFNAPQIRRKHLVWAVGSLLIVATSVSLWVVPGYRDRKRESDAIREQLPPLPDTADWPQVFTEALNAAWDTVAWRDGDFEGLDELARLFHANGFLEEAASCYRLLEGREPGEPRWPYLRALIHFNQGDVTSGKEFLEKALSLKPNALHVLLNLGDAQLKSNQPESALDTYRTCLLLDRNNPYALLGMAREQMRRGETGDALLLLSRLVESSPEFAPGYMLMAQLYDQSGETRKAEVSRALGEERGRYNEPPDPWMDEVMDLCYDVYRLTVRADTERHAGRHESAGLILERAASLAPGDPDVHMLRGFHQQRTGELDKAIQSFESAIRLPGHRSDAYFGLARVFLMRRDHARSIQTARKGLEKFPDSVEIHAMLGEFLLQADSPAQAERHLNIALNRDPNQPNAIKSLANLRLKQGLEREAMEKFEEVRKLAPSDVSSRVTLARHYVKRGAFDKAEAPIREAQELEPEDTELRKLTVDILAANGNRKAAAGQLPDAVASLREAVLLDPSRLDLIRSIALIHANLQEWDAAAENLKTFLNKHSGDVKTWVVLGDVYWSAGNPAEARARWRHAQRLAENQNGAEELFAVIKARLGQRDPNP